MSTQKKKHVPGKLVAGLFRASYAHVFKPAAIHKDKPDEKKYSIVLMVPKSNAALVKLVLKAEKEALEAGKEKWGGKLPPASKMKMAVKDGDEDIDLDKNPEYADHYIFTAKSERKPTVIDAQNEPLTDDEDFYSGCMTEASVKFFAYNHPVGGKGITVQLNSLRKIKDGKRLGAEVASADEDFNYDWEDDDIDLDTDEAPVSKKKPLKKKRVVEDDEDDDDLM